MMESTIPHKEDETCDVCEPVTVECKTLEDCIGKMELALDKHLDARLKTIEFQTAESLTKITALLDGLEQAANMLKSHPLLGSLMSGDEDGFNFG